MRKEMEEKIFQSTEVDAILLTSPANMRFVAGFTGEDTCLREKYVRLLMWMREAEK